MLDDREQRALQELERQIADENPRLARSLAGSGRPAWPSGQGRRLARASTLAVLGLSGVFLLAAGVVGVALSVLSLTGTVWALWWYADPCQAPPGLPPQRPGQRS